MTTIRKLLVTLLLCGAGSAAHAEIRASLDRDRAAVGEAVQLRLLRDSRGGDAPDLSALKADFDVVGSSSETNVQFINGHLSQQSVANITLMAKRAGELRIPAIRWNGETSTPLSLTVTEAAAGAPGDAGPQHVFLAATLDQKQPYVQGNVVLTVTIHTDVPVRQAALNFDGNDDVAVQQLGQDQQDAEEIKGRRYQVIRRRYLLQMQRSGEITLPGPTLDALIEVDNRRDLFGGMLGGGSVRQLRLHGDDILLQVKPRPAGTSSQAWLPAEKLSLVAGWKPEGASLQAGEPLTLHLKMDAVGLTAAQLPDLAAQLQLPEGLRAYPDQAKLDTASKGARVTGSREQDIALIATRPGRYTIPALRLSWWDTVSDTAQTLVLPERVLDVLPAAGATTNAAPSTTEPASASPAPPVLAAPAVATPAQDPIWKWISLVLALLWIATLLLWAIRTRSQRSKTPVPEADGADTQITADSGNAQKNFHRACKDHDPAAARRALLIWSRQVYGGQAPAGLNALAQKLGDPGLGSLLMQLDRACYSGAAWNGDALDKALTRLPASTSASRARPGLAPLY
ncbi:BatD family protein [Hydrocarboniphaga sp.]|uniref:BatD family protein n=1 Tax=Hydrocarboniphaga sp. TaxID=2033016 RepID=UPI003D0ACEEF